MLSIQPKWCGLIANGQKTVEVRKTKPSIATPFKCYIYCTKNKKVRFWIGKRYSYADDRSHNAFDKCGNGKVIGEFVCRDIRYLCLTDLVVKEDTEKALSGSCLTKNEVLDYIKYERGTDIHKAKPFGFYAWQISDLVVYDEPKDLSKFQTKTPPQSWRYVEERENND